MFYIMLMKDHNITNFKKSSVKAVQLGIIAIIQVDMNVSGANSLYLKNVLLSLFMSICPISITYNFSSEVWYLKYLIKYISDTIQAANLYICVIDFSKLLYRLG